MVKKPFRTLDGLIELLHARQLTIEDEAGCRDFLFNHNYYRFSGYARYFQVEPSAGDNTFRPGVSFDDVRRMYELDVEARRLLGDALSEAEVLIRSRFIHIASEDETWAYEGYFDAANFHSGRVSPAADILADLDRSKEPFIRHHCASFQHGGWDYRNLPFWVAAEVLSFGTLSKTIEYLKEDDPKHCLADECKQARTGFTSRIRAFVYLRNRCAHHSRLWHTYMADSPSIPRNVSGRFKKTHGTWDNRSVFATAVALEHFLSHAGSASTFWADFNALLARDPEYRDGIMKPTPYA